MSRLQPVNVSSASMPVPVVSPTPKPVETAGREALPAPLFEGGDATTLAQMMLELAMQQKKQARLMRMNDRKEQEALWAKQDAELRAKADAHFAAGIIGGITKAASGAAGIVQGFKGLAAIHAEREVAARLRLEGELYGAGSKVLEGAGATASAALERTAGEAEEKARQAGRRADRADESADEHKATEAELRDFMERILDSIGKLNDARHGAQQAALLRM